VIPRCSCTCLPLGVIAINSTCSRSTTAAVIISSQLVCLTYGSISVRHCHVQVTGEIIIGEFASANDPDEYEWSVTAEGTGTAQDKLKDHVNTLRKPVFDKLQRYVTALNSLI